jgi:predicted DNA-binding transcriptional regulator YafY
MNRTDRMYALVESLRSAGAYGRTCAWLAQRFEVSTRTVKRDVAALIAAGTPIASCEGRGGGYALRRDGSPGSVTFTSGEAAAIAIALSCEPQLPFSPDGRNALSKVIGAMTPPQRRELASLGARVWIRSRVSAGRARSARVIDEAIRRRVAVRIDYEKRAGDASTRCIEPLAIARTRGEWYVLAWCRERAAGRWFRFDRIRKASITRQGAVHRDLERLFGAPPPDARPLELDVYRPITIRKQSLQERRVRD